MLSELCTLRGITHEDKAHLLKNAQHIHSQTLLDTVCVLVTFIDSRIQPFLQSSFNPQDRSSALP